MDERNEWIFTGHQSCQAQSGQVAGLSSVRDETVGFMDLVSQLPSEGADFQNPGFCLQDSMTGQVL